MRISGQTIFFVSMFLAALAGNFAAYQILNGSRPVLSGSVAGVSVQSTANVEPNSFNTIAKELDDKALELRDKETDLQKREDQMHAKEQAELRVLIGLMAISIFLAVLVCLNLYKDLKQSKHAF